MDGIITEQNIHQRIYFKMPPHLQQAYQFFNKNINIWSEIIQKYKDILNEEINLIDLKNQESSISKIILSIYTMESFLPYILNKTMRE